VLDAEKSIIRFRVQKRVAVSCSLALLVIVIINVCVGIIVRGFSLKNTLLEPSVWVLFTLSVVCSITSLKDWRVFRITHVLVFLGYPFFHTLLAELSPYDTSSLVWSIYGIILGVQYRLLQRKFWRIIGVYLACFLVAKIYSVARSPYFAIHAAPGVIIIVTLFTYLFWIVFAEELEQYSEANVKLNNERHNNQIFVEFGKSIAGVIHNLKSVMMSIQGYSDLLKITDKRDWDSIVDLQKRSSERMLAMINNFNVAVRSYQNAEPQVIHLNHLLSSAIEVLKGNDVLRQRIRIKMELSEPDTIRAVPMAVMQIIDNLVTNAAESMSNTGRFDLTARTLWQSEWVLLQVADQGVGIGFCADCSPRECFRCNHFQIGRTTKSQGTGIGVIYVREEIKKIGGDIKIDSVLDEGTTVTLFFPRVDEPQIEEEPS
jgi:signal transduction histidine kinase